MHIYNNRFKYDNEDGPQMKLYEQLLEDLSSGLRAELVKYIYGNVIKKIRFFIDKPPEFLFRIIPKLKHVIYNKGEIIYKPKETANESIFILYLLSIFHKGRNGPLGNRLI